ncbi:MAG: hypothetical protein DWB48_11205, partial [Nitrosomonas sp.]|nr:hypothetical protein [Nitrosomonas sp.]
LEHGMAAAHTDNQPFVERRGPNRATNVERLPQQVKGHRKTASPGASSSVPTGTDGDWEEF